MKAASEETDSQMVSCILESANITLVHSNLTEAYDELGNHYVIPEYCLSFPSNLAKEKKPTLVDNNIPMEDLKPETLRLRISTGKDLELQMFPYQKISDLKAKLAQLESDNPDNYVLFHMGKGPLEDEDSIGKYREGMIQAMYRNKV